VAVDGGPSTSRLFISATCAEGAISAYAYYNFGCTITGTTQQAANSSLPTFESIRALAEAALLSGRKVNIIYESTSSCGNAMYSMQLT
jgi:hypothetical protein